MNRHKWDKKSLAEKISIKEKDRQQYLNWLNDEDEIFYENKRVTHVTRRRYF